VRGKQAVGHLQHVRDAPAPEGGQVALAGPGADEEAVVHALGLVVDGFFDLFKFFLFFLELFLIGLVGGFVVVVVAAAAARRGPAPLADGLVMLAAIVVPVLLLMLR
jgi:hypothetical protein